MNPFLIEQSAEELRLTLEFQQRVSLSNVRLRSFSARRADKEPEIEEGLELDLKHETKRGEDAASCFIVTMTIEARGDGDPDKLLFRVECEFELTFDVQPDFSPSDEQLIAFERGNAVFLCWPYMREFVQSATARLGLSVPPIPLLRFASPSIEPAAKPRKHRKRTRAA